MPAKSTWTLTVYGSNTDSPTTGTDPVYGLPYLATPVGLTNKTVYILKPQFDFAFNTETLEDISGVRIGYQNRRAVFDVETYPFAYKATAVTLEQDMDDMVALADVLGDFKFLFCRIDGGSRAYPASGYVYPVTLAGWSTSINAQFGNRTVNIQLEHRKRA